MLHIKRFDRFCNNLPPKSAKCNRFFDIQNNLHLQWRLVFAAILACPVAQLILSPMCVPAMFCLAFFLFFGILNLKHPYGWWSLNTEVDEILNSCKSFCVVIILNIITITWAVGVLNNIRMDALWFWMCVYRRR